MNKIALGAVLALLAGCAAAPMPVKDAAATRALALSRHVNDAYAPSTADASTDQAVADAPMLPGMPDPREAAAYARCQYEANAATTAIRDPIEGAVNAVVLRAQCMKAWRAGVAVAQAR